MLCWMECLEGFVLVSVVVVECGWLVLLCDIGGELVL